MDSDVHNSSANSSARYRREGAQYQYWFLHRLKHGWLYGDFRNVHFDGPRTSYDVDNF